MLRATVPAVLVGLSLCHFSALGQQTPAQGAKPPSASAPASTSQASTPDPLLAIDQWNISKRKLAIDGYDPVAYFPEGGSKPTRGMESLETEYKTVKFRFATAKNKEAFLANPEKYIPAHGGWCSWAMREGDKVDVDVKSFIVKDGRLFLFYDGLLGDTRAKWLKGDHTKEAAEADGQWKKVSGESPRQVAALPIGAQNVVATALKVGAIAPDAKVRDVKGAEVSLASLWEKGPVVMTWYRGGWCPYCNVQLKEYQARLADFNAAGATLVAISPQLPDASLSTAEKDGLAFPVLSDQGNAAAHAFGLAYALPEELGTKYRKMIDFARVNGDEMSGLPLAATYVIDKGSKITYAFVDEDFRKRAPVQELVNAVQALPRQ
ncbi:MAG: redoxin domain-containing protein [Planctomycetes bacterium]|nr:redoxin domain-containing protein [Planctomycetota bacterium]